MQTPYGAIEVFVGDFAGGVYQLFQSPILPANTALK